MNKWTMPIILFQIEWAKMEDEYDVVKIGYGDDCQTYPIVEDLERWKELMEKQVGFAKKDVHIDSYAYSVALMFCDYI